MCAVGSYAHLAYLGVQVDWLRGFLGGEGSTLAKAILWAGIQPVPSRAGPLEAVLRSKCILLLAVTLKRRAVRLPLVAPSPSFPSSPTPLTTPHDAWSFFPYGCKNACLTTLASAHHIRSLLDHSSLGYIPPPLPLPHELQSPSCNLPCYDML